MSNEVVAIIVIALIVLAIVVWLLYLASALILGFTVFVLELPLIVSIIMFIVFPPTLIVFLVGLAFIRFGIADAFAGSSVDEPKLVDGPKRSDRAAERERKRRQALGYEE